jgi:hypothetical protein
MFNNKWVTPDSVRTALGPDPDGDRPQPGRLLHEGHRGPADVPGRVPAARRLLVSTLLGTGRTIVHGGFGVYYDREIWNHLIDERFRLNWIVRFFDFTTTRTTRAGSCGTRSTRACAGLQGAGQPGYGRQPRYHERDLAAQERQRAAASNQFNFGVRQTVSKVVLGAAYRGVRART